LREWRERRRLTHDALASLLGTTRPNLIAYEKGRRRPSPPTVAALATALGIDPAQLAVKPRADWTLEDLRAFSGWSKSDAAAALGVARATYDAMEAGRRTFRADLLDALADELGCRRREVRAAHRRSLTAPS
jgi:transcriptional regulator with XRE-family HTH domain